MQDVCRKPPSAPAALSACGRSPSSSPLAPNTQLRTSPANNSVVLSSFLLRWIHTFALGFTLFQRDINKNTLPNTWSFYKHKDIIIKVIMKTSESCPPAPDSQWDHWGLQSSETATDLSVPLKTAGHASPSSDPTPQPGTHAKVVRWSV